MNISNTFMHTRICAHAHGVLANSPARSALTVAASAREPRRMSPSEGLPHFAAGPWSSRPTSERVCAFARARPLLVYESTHMRTYIYMYVCVYV